MMINKLTKLLPPLMVTVLTFASTACSPVKVLNSLIPTNGHEIKRDLQYGTHARQQLDIYIPSHSTQNALPVVVFFYGGSWDSGNKEDYLFAAEAFASRGYVTVIPNYRVYPEVKFPAVMQDPASAAKWIKMHIAEYGGDPNNIFMVGHSAGAHLITMLALNKNYFSQVALTPNDFSGYVGLAGPYDFLPLKSARLKEIFGPEESQWESQPIRFVDGSNPNLQLLVGLKDSVVWPRNTFNLAEVIRQHHGKVEVVEFAHYGHIDMIAKLAKPLRGNSRLLDAVDAFLKLNVVHDDSPD
ncbi:MAG: alpha/beta hydrolase [Methylophilales bacterium 28-44-11]|nr:MAG: alpha/beta hydrolase [Methylophilales bacterium 28-44-11]